MRALLTALAVLAVVLILIGVLLKALRWLLIIGLIALAASIIMAVVQGRRSANRHGQTR